MSLHNPIADGAIDQSVIDKQSKTIEESMMHVKRYSGYQEKLTAYHREVAKITEYKKQLREQEEYVQQLGRELDSDYNEIQDNNNEIPMYIDPKTGEQ